MHHTGELPTRYGVESRPSRSNIHLLHSAKTDEIEVLESGAINHHTNIGNSGAEHSRTKVSFLLLQIMYFRVHYLQMEK